MIGLVLPGAIPGKSICYVYTKEFKVVDLIHFRAFDDSGLQLMSMSSEVHTQLLVFSTLRDLSLRPLSRATEK